MKQVLHLLRSYWAKFVQVLFPDRNRGQHEEDVHNKIAKDPGDQLPDRIYYSIPGARTYTGYIYKGRILKSGTH